MENRLKHVLFIDDDKFNNFINTRIATKHKAFDIIVSFTNGNEALQYLIEVSQNSYEKPDMIFLDLNMPGMNGWEFIQEFEKIDSNFIKDIHIFLLTSSINPDDIEKSKAIPLIKDYFSKPLSIELLQKIVTKYCKKKHI